MFKDFNLDKIDLKKIEELYSQCLKKYGFQPQSVGWNDEKSHFLRFEKLVQVIEDPSTSITINDLGCGYGALFSFLVARQFNVSLYRGYDISQNMINAAQTFISDKRAFFIQSNVLLHLADYSFASGIFNVKFDIDVKLWEKYIIYILNNLNQFSLKGFAFNLLTTYVDFKRDHLYYGDPLFYFDFCKRHFSKKVSLLHDYDLFEWTILVKK